MSSPPPPHCAAASYCHRHRRRRRRRRKSDLNPPLRRMKLMYFLMDKGGKQQRKVELEFEVSELESVLEKEQRLSKILQCSLQGRVVCHSCLSSLVPLKVKVLLAELAVVEEEIYYLERKVEGLRLRLERERDWTHHCALPQHSWPIRQQRQLLCGLGCRKELRGDRHLPIPPSPDRDRSSDRESKASVGSTREEEVERTRRRSPSSDNNVMLAERKNTSSCHTPNKLSEELLRLLIAIFHKLSSATNATAMEELSSSSGGGGGASRLHISCIGSRGLAPRTQHTGTSKSKAHALGSRAPMPDGDGRARELGSDRGFVEFTRSSVDMSRASSCLADIKSLRALMHELCTVDPSLLANKQTLAFWLNIYNFCIMHAFLQHGLPPSPDRLLALLNQASVNVGGTVLDASSIEHLILRHAPEAKHGIMHEGERDLQHNYGLDYPEPNVVFALCRGSRSSPALRVYTAEDVSNELERAKMEYLESSVRVAGKRRVVVPKLLHCHMRDFADDAESLLEWIYSQLPRSSAPLKRVIRELLGTGDPKASPAKMLEIEPYSAEFHYSLPLW